MKRFEEVASLLACTVDDLDIKRVTEEQEQKLVTEESDLNLAILVWLPEAVGLLVLAHVLPQSQHTRATARPSTGGAVLRVQDRHNPLRAPMPLAAHQTYQGADTC